MEDQSVLDEQLAYYRARAPEYDEWFMRTGRYDRGPEHRAEWFQEVGRIEAALEPVIKDRMFWNWHAEQAGGRNIWRARVHPRLRWTQPPKRLN